MHTKSLEKHLDILRSTTAFIVLFMFLFAPPLFFAYLLCVNFWKFYLRTWFSFLMGMICCLSVIWESLISEWGKCTFMLLAFASFLTRNYRAGHSVVQLFFVFFFYFFFFLLFFFHKFFISLVQLYLDNVTIGIIRSEMLGLITESN